MRFFLDFFFCLDFRDRYKYLNGRRRPDTGALGCRCRRCLLLELIGVPGFWLLFLTAVIHERRDWTRRKEEIFVYVARGAIYGGFCMLVAEVPFRRQGTAVAAGGPGWRPHRLPGTDDSSTNALPYYVAGDWLVVPDAAWTPTARWPPFLVGKVRIVDMRRISCAFREARATGLETLDGQRLRNRVLCGCLSLIGQFACDSFFGRQPDTALDHPNGLCTKNDLTKQIHLIVRFKGL